MTSLPRDTQTDLPPGPCDVPLLRVYTAALASAATTVPALFAALRNGRSESPQVRRGVERAAGYVPGKAGLVCPRGGKGVCCMASWWSLVNCWGRRDTRAKKIIVIGHQSHQIKKAVTGRCTNRGAMRTHGRRTAQGLGLGNQWATGWERPVPFLSSAPWQLTQAWRQQSPDHVQAREACGGHWAPWLCGKGLRATEQDLPGPEGLRGHAVLTECTCFVPTPLLHIWPHPSPG